MELSAILVSSAILLVNLVHGYDPTAVVNVSVLEVKTLPNPYFGEWSGTILGNGDVFSAKLPIKKDVPETMLMRVEVEFEGILMFDTDVLLCDAMEDEAFGKGVAEKGIPKGEFPKKCPMKAGLNYEVVNYEALSENIPIGTPNGRFSTHIKFHEPDQEPILLVHFAGTISHKLPGIPLFGR